MASAEKVLNLICLFNTTQQEFSAQEVSQNLETPLSTTYKYLDLLNRKGFLIKNPETKRFGLGFTIFKLGNLMINGLRVVDIALPYMKKLSANSQETVLLSALNGWEAICIERIETQRLIKLSLEPGASFPLHASAPSKILLAYQDESLIEAFIEKTGLPKLTKNTIKDPARLRKELEKIKKQGFAFSNSEADYGAGSIAAPIFNHKGRVVAGLALAGPVERVNIRKFPKIVTMVKEHAFEISCKIGYQP